MGNKTIHLDIMTIATQARAAQGASKPTAKGTKAIA